jgi:hypothetical protein
MSYFVDWAHGSIAFMYRNVYEDYLYFNVLWGQLSKVNACIKIFTL